jgi:hypothetical protein
MNFGEREIPPKKKGGTFMFLSMKMQLCGVQDTVEDISLLYELTSRRSRSEESTLHTSTNVQQAQIITAQIQCKNKYAS